MKQLITLQINLSPGDADYAHLTVPALVANHKHIKERLLIIDCLKAKKTKIFDPAKRYMEPIYSSRLTKIKLIARKLLKDKVVSKVYLLEEGDPLIEYTSKKYFSNIVKETHEYGGIGITSYLAGLEISKTQFVLHFDGDMLFYQKENFNWSEKAIEYLEKNSDCISVSPGSAPLNGLNINKPSYDIWSNYKIVPEGYKDEFFSARQFLIDKEKLSKLLPVMKGFTLLETLLVKYLRRGYPRAVENVFFKRFKNAGKYRFIMDSENCWTLHPLDKPSSYINLLPEIIFSINKGTVPKSQVGYENIKLNSWIEFLNKS